MKKLVLLVGLFGSLFFLSSKVNAGTPMEQLLINRTSYSVPASTSFTSVATQYPITGNWNTVISSYALGSSGAPTIISLPVVQSTISFNFGVTNSTYQARNCITDLSVQLSAGSTFYLLDGNTTSYYIYGGANLAFSGATGSIWTKHWDHLGPWCGTAGSVTTLQIPAPGAATTLNAINADGYTVITGLAAIYNVNQ